MDDDRQAPQADAPSAPGQARRGGADRAATGRQDTLAQEVAAERDAVYVDLERPSDLAKLSDVEQYCAENADRLVILDAVRRAPGLFGPLRGIIDRRRLAGKRAGMFLLLGSASVELLRQSGETLAGRVAQCELHPFGATEVPADPTPALVPRRSPRQLPRARRRREPRLAGLLHPHVPRTRHSAARSAHSRRDPAPVLDDARPQPGADAQRGGPRAGWTSTASRSPGTWTCWSTCCSSADSSPGPPTWAGGWSRRRRSTSATAASVTPCWASRPSTTCSATPSSAAVGKASSSRTSPAPCRPARRSATTARPAAPRSTSSSTSARARPGRWRSSGAPRPSSLADSTARARTSGRRAGSWCTAAARASRSRRTSGR